MSDSFDPTRTRVMRSNQYKIDELEFFIEGIARMLFGPEAEDYRKLQEYVPTTANVSLLIDKGRALGGKDVAEDFQFIYSELEKHHGDDPAGDYPEFNPQVGLLRYDAYMALATSPETVLGKIEHQHREQVKSLHEQSPQLVKGALASINAYAWFGLLGLPDIASEFDPAAKRAALSPDEQLTVRALERIQTQLALDQQGVRAYLAKCHYLLHLEYRQQLAKLLDG